MMSHQCSWTSSPKQFCLKIANALSDKCTWLFAKQFFVSKLQMLFLTNALILPIAPTCPKSGFPPCWVKNQPDHLRNNSNEELTPNRLNWCHIQQKIQYLLPKTCLAFFWPLIVGWKENWKEPRSSLTDLKVPRKEALYCLAHISAKPAHLTIRLLFGFVLILYLLHSTKISTNTETAMLSTYFSTTLSWLLLLHHNLRVHWNWCF